MPESESAVAQIARKMRDSELPRKDSRAENCPNDYVLMARAKWPSKTARHWARAAGCSEESSVAKAWLRGEVSPAGKLAIIHLFK